MEIRDIIDYVCDRCQIVKKNIADELGMNKTLFSRHCREGIMSAEEFLDVMRICGIKVELYVREKGDTIETNGEEPSALFIKVLESLYGTSHKKLEIAGLTVSQIYERRAGIRRFKAKEFLLCMHELGVEVRLRCKKTGYFISYSDSRAVSEKIQGVLYNNQASIPITNSFRETGSDSTDLDAELFYAKDGNYLMAIYCDAGDRLMICTEEEAKRFVETNGNKAMDIAS